MNGRPNIVLVHGAWADGSCWSGVIERLQAEGFQVRAPQFPLSSLADDVARLRQVLEFQDGPTIVVGHSYGGQIMTALGSDAPNVVGLVYIAAFALDEGESLGALLSQGPVTPALAHLFTDSRGYGWLSEDDFVNHFAGDVEPTRARVMYAVQQPLASSGVHRRHGRAGVEVVAVLVSRGSERRGASARRRAAVRSADGCDHGGDPGEPRRDGLPSRRGRRPDREGRRSSRCRCIVIAEASVRYADTSTERVAAGNVEYAYRDVGDGDVPLVLLQHFRGNLDNWDPALIDALAADRRVVTFDNVGVGATTGTTPNTVEAMAHGAIAFLEALDVAASRSARLLDRQLRRAGDRARPSRPAAARRARLVRTTGRSGDARLGAGGDRRGR